jgi:hypothetical protein
MARRGFVDHKKEVVYFWAQKCACTTLFATLVNTYGERNKTYHRSSQPWNECLEIIEKKNYRSTMITRNPYDRTISCYLNKFVDGRVKGISSLVERDDLESFSKALHREMQIIKGEKFLKNVMTFEDFLTSISSLMSKREDPNENSVNGHWDTQIPPAALKFEYDHLVRMETFEEGFSELCREFDLKYNNAKKNATRYQRSDDAYLGNLQPADLLGKPFSKENFRNPTTDALIRELYATDFEMFKYPT